MPYECLIVDKKDTYAVVTLNRPPANAISSKLMEELDAAIDELDDDAAVRCIVLTGSGDRFFSAGADIKEMSKGGGVVGDKTRGTLRRHQAVTTRIDRCYKPVIAALNGMALGGGCELALACHMRIAAEDVTLGQPEVNLGIIPGYGGTQRLPRLVGKAKGLEMALLGTLVSAREALDIGLVNRVVPNGQLMAEVDKLARKLAKQPPIAVRLILDAVSRGLDTTLEQGLGIEAENFGEAIASEDAREGITAFIEKREPKFKGR
jgi:enoyl-CoA hydratase/carnithine racemase